SDPQESSAYARQVAERLAAQRPAQVVARMTKAVRRGKVLVDWSQNNAAKTTVAPYSLRGRERPTVSTPLTWEEVEACEKPGDLVFTAEDAVDRVQRLGDLFAPLQAVVRADRPT